MSITHRMSEMMENPFGLSAAGHRCFHCGELLQNPAVMWSGHDGQTIYLHDKCMRTVLPEREVMTLSEAADFLRFSTSMIYKRHELPCHRLQGSRQIRFLRSELLAWIKGELTGKPVMKETDGVAVSEPRETQGVDIAREHIYHRNKQYR